MAAKLEWISLKDLQNTELPTKEQRRVEDQQRALTVYRLVREIAIDNSPAETHKLLFGRKTGADIPGSGYLADYLPKFRK